MRAGRLILALVAAVVIIAVIVLVAFFVRSGTGEASQVVTAPTLEIAVRPTSDPTPAQGDAATEEAIATVEADATAEAAASGELVVFSLVTGEASASFELDEDLRGQRTTVIGTTTDIAGQIAVDFANPANSQAGIIRFNLRTLATDNDFRNRAIRGEILQSSRDEFEFGQFTPTGMIGLPTAAVEEGASVSFQIVGDLMLRDVTNPVTFDVILDTVTPDRITGTATATVNRTDWGLTIPDVPGVANVEEDVVLTLTIVATPDGS